MTTTNDGWLGPAGVKLVREALSLAHAECRGVTALLIWAAINALPQEPKTSPKEEEYILDRKGMP